MKTSEVYTSDWLKHSDIGGVGDRKVVTINDAKQVEYQDGERAIGVRFKEFDKTFGLNKTNCGAIEEATGSDDTDDWIGKQVTLYVTYTEFQGKQTKCLRVEPEAPKKASADKPAPASTVSPDAVEAALKHFESLGIDRSRVLLRMEVGCPEDVTGPILREVRELAVQIGKNKELAAKEFPAPADDSLDLSDCPF